MRATIYTHSTIYPSAFAEPIDGGIAVREGSIVCVGTVAECRDALAEQAPTVALRGAAVLPGLYDTHLHSGSLAQQFHAPDVSTATSLDDALAQLRSWAATHTGGGWVVGGRWDANRWGGDTLTSAALDEVFGDRPVILNTIDSHSVCLNSAGLELLGYTDASEPFPGGVIEKDAHGRLTGILRENDSDRARDIVNATLLADAAPLLAEVQQHLHARGVTAITDFDGDEVRAGFEALAARDELRLRVRKGIAATSLDAAIAAGERTGERSPHGPEWLVTGPVKLFSDGALGSHTALLHAPYDNEGCNCGVEVAPTAELADTVERANRYGIAVNTHAIGDRANTNVLDAYEQHTELTRSMGLRNAIEHAQHLKAADITRIAELGVIASMQPTHCTSDYPLSVQLLGNRDTLHYPWRSLLDAGATVTFGSDAPIEPADALYGIHAAVTRRRRDGAPEGGREPAERVTVAEALHAYTQAAADAAGLGDRMGSLAPGKFGDFITVDSDPFTCAPDDLWRIRVLQTIVGGHVQFERGEE